MNNRTLAMLSYVTIIGWLIAFFVKREDTDALRRYHLKQGLGLFITMVILNIITTMIARTSPSLTFLAGVASLLILILAIIGILTASKEEKKPLPLIGKYCEGQFNFI